MGGVSLIELSKNLRALTWSPIALITFVFLFSIGMLMQQQRDRQADYLESDLGDIIEVQQRAFANEVFLNKEEALNLRMDAVAKTFREKAPTLDICLSLIPLHPTDSNKIITRCTNPKDLPQWQKEEKVSLERIIRAGVVPNAKVRYAVIRTTRWKDLLPWQFVAIIVVSLLGAYYVHRREVKTLQRDILAPLLQQIKDDERNAAMAQAAQILAHEARKPFVMLKKSMRFIEQAETFNDFKSRKSQVLPDVDDALKSVDTMLSEVLDMRPGAEGKPEKASPRWLAKKAVKVVLLSYPAAKSRIRYEFEHRYRSRVEARKIIQVISNLVENAIQAMDEEGELWIKTKEVESTDGKRLTEFCVGNSGSYIRPEHRKKVFEAFFTRKDNGNGLGLAIAKKVVKEHGGEIWCTSSHETGTEFFFTVPSSNSPDNETSESARLVPVRASTERPGPAKQILLFDDDHLVHDGWSISAERRGIANLVHFQSWEEFIAKDGFALAHDSVAFVDVHFPKSKFDGLDIATNLKRLGIRRLYAVTGDPAKARASGLFDNVFGKEMPDDIKHLAGLTKG